MITISFDPDLGFFQLSRTKTRSFTHHCQGQHTSLDIFSGCTFTWNIYTLEGETRLPRGDMPMIQFQLILQTLSIFKEVQTISVDGGDYNVDPTSTSN